MPRTPRPKKTDGIYLRFEEKLAADFSAACAASGLTQQEALRLAAAAMVVACDNIGTIPRDMAIRQAVRRTMREARDLHSALQLLQAAVERDRLYPERRADADLLAAEDELPRPPEVQPLPPEETAKLFDTAGDTKRSRQPAASKQGGA